MIALYVRLSVADREALGPSESVVTQEAQLRAFVAQHPDIGRPGEEVRVFCDDGISGMRDDRPALASLIACATAGEVSCVVVRDHSRLARNYLLAGMLLSEVLPVLGVRVIALGDGYDSVRTQGRTEEELMLAFRNVINEAYSLAASERILATIRTIWGRGEHYCAWVPFGYLYDKASRGHVRKDPAAEGTVRLIFGQAAVGLGPCAIARDLNARGLLTPAELRCVRAGGSVVGEDGVRVARWCAGKVSTVLSREAYMGTLVAGVRTREKVGSERKVRRDPSEWVRVEDAHEAIVSRETFLAAQRVLRPRDGRAGR